jgi:hypothetical protein
MKFTFSFSVVFGLALLDSANGQTVTAAKDTPANLAALLLKPAKTGIQILSALVGDGEEGQFGQYKKVAQIFPGLANKGIILSSGKVSNVQVGGNDEAYDGPGDEEMLNLVVGNYVTADAASLVISVLVPVPVTVTFSFVFGSNNYHADVSNFPDLFAFFLNGVNQAKIGGTAVSAALINCGPEGTGIGPNCDQLVNNVDPDDPKAEVFTSMNAYTKTQTMSVLIPAGQHTIKIAIADAYTFIDEPDEFDAFDDAYVLMSFQSAVVAAPVPVPAMMGMAPMAMMGMMAR